jgi:hypothetical protein
MPVGVIEGSDDVSVAERAEGVKEGVVLKFDLLQEGGVVLKMPILH